MTVFDVFDYVTGKIMLPLGGMLISIFAGWILDKQILWKEVSNNGTLKVHTYKLVLFLLRFVVPVSIGLVFINELGLFK